MDNDLDCGDNSCLFATKKGGMRTNGGCRCLQEINDANKRRAIKRRLLNGANQYNNRLLESVADLHWRALKWEVALRAIADSDIDDNADACDYMRNTATEALAPTLASLSPESPAFHKTRAKP